MRRMPALLALLCLLAVPGFAQEADDPAVTAALEQPGATGLLVTALAPEGQAGPAGVRLGDILVAYDGKPTPDVAALKAAMPGATGEKIALDLVRGGEKKSVTLHAGPIGVGLVPVQQGKRYDPLPPATGVKFDFSRLDKAGEAWYAFSPDGVKKIGFEYYRWRIDQGNVVLDSEVAFDGGKEFGLNHFVVTVTVAKGDHPEGRSCRFENPLKKEVLEGRRVADPKAPSAGWETVVQTADGKQETRRGLGAGDLIPSYFVYALAQCMPRTKGACYRFTPIDEWAGTIGKPSALVVEGEEATRVGDQDVPTWKVVWVSRTGVMNTHWVDAAGDVLRTDYGGERGTATSKEEALKDLHPDLHPRSGR
ncbi:MAG: PDZ domain-containing protein [Planctomycetes bacterium]|nr:PDZ domain-containing protein [Planctomycetota bacterium]